VVRLRVLDLFLRRLRYGELEVVWPDGPSTWYRGELPGPSAVLVVRNAGMADKIALGGPIGFAEGYVDALWDTPDLVALLDLFAANLEPGALARRRVPLAPLQRLAHLTRANTRRGARRNIIRHYDLGNDFYRLWLDPTMTYSCALFPDADDPVADDVHVEATSAAAEAAGTGASPPTPGPTAALEAAQRAKWDALLDAIAPRPGERLLEIGSGWGGFAIHAARTRGCEVVGVTLSDEQLAYSVAAAQEAGVEDVVRFRLQDYRDVTDMFDHVASIEMFEAVGERYWPLFFTTVRKVMKPGGRAGIQVITIDAARFETYRRRPDFTQTYIFPGGMLPSREAFAYSAGQAALVTASLRQMGSSYARTLSCWLSNFEAALDDVRALGFDDPFIRMWRYYLGYCITGFRRGMIDVVQVTLT